MFGLSFQKQESKLDEPIDKVLDELREHDPESPEFATNLTNLERLTNLKAEESKRRVSPDTMAIVAGNLLGILIVIKYEQFHVVTSKAMGMLLRTKSSSHS